MAKPQSSDPSLYERDFHAWAVEQAEKLRARSYNEIDLNTVAEEIESLGRSDRREIESRMNVLLMHLIKYLVQPEGRSESWRATIREQRFRIAGLIGESPSLAAYPASVLHEEYELARRKAAAETGLPLSTIPEHCPFSVEQVLDAEFLPA